jgi:hypothetical protein
MRNVYGDYIVLSRVTDADEILEKVSNVLPQLVHQAQVTNRALGGTLDLDTLEFIVHTKQDDRGVTVAWKCWDKEVSKV